MLLTEAHFWARLPDPPPGARFGWWTEDDEASAAFVQVPDHPVITSPLHAAAAAALPPVLADVDRLGVQARDVAIATAAWRAHGLVLTERARWTLLRLDELRAGARPEGGSRPARVGDLPLLRSWFELFQERHPDDASHVAFVIDQPVEEGGVLVWEVDGRPAAMASRTPEAAGMTRMGLAFQPTEGTAYADAAFDAACAEAARTSEHVLVLSGTDESTAVHRSRGFVPVLERVQLAVRTG